MGDPVPITPDVAAWARQEAGLSQPELASLVGCDTKEVRDWETGKSRPTGDQFPRLCSVLERPSALFFLPEPPPADPTLASLRKSADTIGCRLQPDEIVQIRWVLRLQRLAEWVLQDQRMPPVCLPRYRAGRSPGDVGNAERFRSNVSPAAQTGCGSSEAEFRMWVHWLETQGVYVMQIRLGAAGVDGFTSWDDHAPVLVVSGDLPFQSRTNTLFRGFSRFLAGSDDARHRVVPSDQKGDPWGSEFAAAFLMSTAPGRERTATLLGGGSVAARPTDRVGKPMLRLLLGAVDRNRLNTRDLAEHLQLTVSQVGHLRERVTSETSE